MVRTFVVHPEDDLSRPETHLVGLLSNAITHMSLLERFECFWRSADHRLLAALASCSSTLHSLILGHPIYIASAHDDSGQYPIMIPSLPRLRELAIFDYSGYTNPRFRNVIHELIRVNSGSLQALRACWSSPAFGAMNFRAGNWTELRSLKTTDLVAMSSPDILVRLAHLESIRISFAARLQDLEISAIGHSAARYLPRLTTVECVAQHLPLFFPPLSQTDALSCSRQVTSLTVIISRWADDLVHFPNSIQCSPLAVSLTRVQFKLMVIELSKLVEVLHTLNNLETLILTLAREKGLLVSVVYSLSFDPPSDIEYT